MKKTAGYSILLIALVSIFFSTDDLNPRELKDTWSYRLHHAFPDAWFYMVLPYQAPGQLCGGEKKLVCVFSLSMFFFF